MVRRENGRWRTRRYTMILVIWALLGMLAGGVRYASQPATYEASARLYIHHIGPGDPGDFLRNATAIRSQAVTAGALDRVRLNPQPFLGKEQLTARTVFRELTVDPDDMGAPAEGVVTIRYRGKSRDECLQVLSGVIESYLAVVEDLQHPFTSEFLEKLDFAHRQLLELRQGFGSGEEGKLEVPEPWLADLRSEAEDYAALQRLIGQLEQRRARLEGELLGLHQADLAGLEPALGAAPTPQLESPAPAPRVPEPAREPPARVTASAELHEAMTAPLRRQLRELSRQFGPDHVQIQQTRKKLASIQSAFETEPYVNQELVELIVELQLLRETYGEGHPRIGALKKQIEDLRVRLREKARGQVPDDEVVESAGTESRGRFVWLQVDPPGRAETGTDEEAPRTPLEERKERVLAQLAQVDSELVQLRPLLQKAQAERLFEIVTRQLDSIRWSQQHGGMAVHLLDPVGEAEQVSRGLFLYLVLGLAGGLFAGGTACIVIMLWEQKTPASAERAAAGAR
jgi:uncharacterized protein involved in exopolysaccharide biosynthesis